MIHPPAKVLRVEPITSLLELRLLQERNGAKRSMIYVDGQEFKQCMFLLFQIDPNAAEAGEIDSIDKAAELPGARTMETRGEDFIAPEEEFWGHLSNLIAWVEHDYDTRILHSNMAFPLLKELARVGDAKAKRVLQGEIIDRLRANFAATAITIIHTCFDVMDDEAKILALKTPPSRSQFSNLDPTLAMYPEAQERGMQDDYYLKDFEYISSLSLPVLLVMFDTLESRGYDLHYTFLGITNALLHHDDPRLGPVLPAATIERILDYKFSPQYDTFYTVALLLTTPRWRRLAMERKGKKWVMARLSEQSANYLHKILSAWVIRGFDDEADAEPWLDAAADAILEKYSPKKASSNKPFIFNLTSTLARVLPGASEKTLQKLWDAYGTIMASRDLMDNKNVPSKVLEEIAADSDFKNTVGTSGRKAALKHLEWRKEHGLK